jgi:hypothetical protein
MFVKKSIMSGKLAPFANEPSVPMNIKNTSHLVANRNFRLAKEKTRKYTV